MKPIRLTKHALLQCLERGATEEEVIAAVEIGIREAAKKGRMLCRYNVPFNQMWQDSIYAIKQIAPIIIEEPDEIVVVTVYTFYF